MNIIFVILRFILENPYMFIIPISNPNIVSFNIYNNVSETVQSTNSQLNEDLHLNQYQTIEKYKKCECCYENDSSDSWDYYIIELLRPDNSIGRTFLEAKNKPFICTTKMKNNECYGYTLEIYQ